MKQLIVLLVLFVLGIPNIFNFTSVKDGRVNCKSYDTQGDGIADDTANLQRCFDYAKSHNLTVYLPSGHYVVTKSLNATVANGFFVYGDGADTFGKSGTILLDELTEPYAVIDFSGCMECGIERVGIYTNNGAYSYSGTQSTSGVLVSPGPERPVDGGFHFTLRDTDVAGPGLCPGCAAVVIVGSDWPLVESYLGGPLVMGATLGRSTNVKSKFYDVSKVLPDGNPTMEKLSHAQFGGEYVPGLQLTGAQYYVIDDIDVGMYGSGAAGTMIESTSQVGQGVLENYIHGVGVRTENFTPAFNSGKCGLANAISTPGCGINALTFADGRSTGGYITGNFCTDPAGHVLHIASNLWVTDWDMLGDFCEAAPFFLIDKGARVYNDTFRIGQGTVSLGQIDSDVDWEESEVKVPVWENFDVQKAVSIFPPHASGTFGPYKLGGSSTLLRHSKSRLPLSSEHQQRPHSSLVPR